MLRQMTIILTRFHSFKVQFNKSLLSTETALKMYLICGQKESEFGRSSLVTLLAVEKQLLTNQDQVIMPSWLPKVSSWLRKNALRLN